MGTRRKVHFRPDAIIVRPGLAHQSDVRNEGHRNGLGLFGPGHDAGGKLSRPDLQAPFARHGDKQQMLVHVEHLLRLPRA